MRNPTGKPGSGAPSSVSSPAANLKRRRFLYTLGAGSAGMAAATVVALPSVAALIPPVTEPAAATSGYRETEHVRTYYRTAKV